MANVAAEYDSYHSVPALEWVGAAVFGDAYLKQKSSVWPRDVLDAARSLGAGHGCRVLDAGCGNGWASTLLARELGAQCTGWDLSPANIAEARELAGGVAGCCFEVRDMADSDGYDRSFDLILSIGSLYWATDPARVAVAWNTMLRPGGSVLTLITHTDDPAGIAEMLPGTSAAAAATDWPALFEGHGLRVTTADRTDRFAGWLDAWLVALHDHEAAVVAEMGAEGYAAFERRFSSMRRGIGEGSLRRLEVRALADRPTTARGDRCTA
ncbi:MAG TPA: methyltransferase domain-containing protein [Candidatus Limnocylindrales bacterium]|nr:methyltransferase domain-containing protein [Candidatus Limnocylindrales bacterium]